MRISLLTRVLEKWPLRKQLGFYAYLPAFFVLGAGMEFVMINMRIGNVDFYSVYLTKERERAQQEVEKLKQILDKKKEQLVQQNESSKPSDSTQQ